MQKALPIQKKGLEDVKALKRPDKDKAELKRIFAAADGAFSAYEQASQDPNATLALLKASDTAQDPAAEANRITAAYGLKECAK